MKCRYDGADRPRIVIGRHADDCSDEGCDSCQPCPWPHCRRCGVAHAEHTCAGCIADARTDLDEILRLCAALPAEAIVKGVESEAMNLLGPVADPEALGHMRASVNVGRIPAEWLEAADDDRHPLLVLGTWTEAYVEAFEHAEPARITVASAGSYLQRNLHFAAAEPDVPFEDFARDLAACRTYLERVLHDGEQVDTGAPCLTCSRPLRRVWDGEPLPWSSERQYVVAPADGWACTRCRDWRSEPDYRLNVAELHRDAADWQTDRDLEIRTGVKASTVRSWGREGGPVRRRRDSGRTLYAVADVEREAQQKGMMSA